MGLCGFGGVGPIARHVIIEKRRWMTEHDYATLLGMGQILPGGNIINMAILLGDRFQGPLGSIVALSGLIVMPITILLLLTTVYDAFADNPDVRAAMIGAGAAGAGLIIGMCFKMWRSLKLHPVHVGFVAVTFLAMGVLRLPLGIAFLAISPACIAATWWLRRR
jgi:chromate transporter